MKTAKDIMTPNPKFISSGEELRRATELFFENNIHFAPIVTPNKEVLGLLSEIGLVKAALKRYLDPDANEKVIHHRELYEVAVFVEETDSMELVVKAMMKSENHRVLVRNRQGLMVGIISPKDILRLVTGQQLKSSNLHSELNKSKEEAQALAQKLSSLEQSLKLYRNVFEDSPYMMHSVNAEGIIIMANRRIHDVLGYGKDELLNRKLNDLYPKSIVHEAYSGLSTIIEKGVHQMTYTSMLRKNGEKVRVDIASSSFKSAKGEFLGTITISREVDAEELLRALNGIMDPPTRIANQG